MILRQNNCDIAVANQTPLCAICGQPTMVPIYKDESDLPISQRIIGDNIVGWKLISHNCAEEFFKVNNKLTTSKE